MNSRNHIMQGSIGAWLWTDVAGISQQPGTGGWGQLLLWPRATAHADLPSAAGVYKSIRGTVALSWLNATSGAFQLNATVPPNTAAEVRLPFDGAPATLEGSEGGVAFFKNGAFIPNAVPGISGAYFSPSAPGTLSVAVGSGTYAFVSVSAP